MARIQLSVAVDYLPEWGIYEGLRELTQNFIDSQDDSGIKGDIRFEGGALRGKVIMTNPGAKSLTREALLFGVTSKSDRVDQRGQFGEGMKVGTLALTRAGCDVTIRTQTETWKASIEPSAEFGNRKVLTFATRKRERETDTVEVEIYPILREDWEKIQKSFMFMQENVDAEKNSYGSILKGDEFRGKLFAKGIFVKDVNDAKFGYDIADITLNRDRSMIDEWSARNSVVSMLSHAYDQGKINLDDIIGFFTSSSWESVDAGYSWSYQGKVMKDIATHLSRNCEGKGVFTHSAEEAVKIESFGWHAIRVTKPLFDAMRVYVLSDEESSAKFRKKIGVVTMTQLSEIMRESVKEVVAHSDLTEGEKNSLDWATNILKIADIEVYPRVCIFHDENIIGLYQTGLISISRKVLADKHEVLATLIHEYSHPWGPDGSIGHSTAIERHWTKVARALLA
jgi:hypothetical protein